MQKNTLLTTVCAVLMTTACSIDSYEKGEGDYSLMTAELVEAHVGSDKYIKFVETDQGETLNMTPPFTSKWIEKEDTVYRALLYYNKMTDGTAQAVSCGRVSVLMPRDSFPTNTTADVHKKDYTRTDPIHLESVWMSKNKKYLNLRMRLLTGSTDDEDAVHVIGLLRDTIASTTSHVRLQLCHDQGGRPEYYSFTAYASIPLASVQSADTITLTVNTYDGLKTMSFF